MDFPGCVLGCEECDGGGCALVAWVCFIWFPAWFGIAWFAPGTSILGDLF